MHVCIRMNSDRSGIHNNPRIYHLHSMRVVLNVYGMLMTSCVQQAAYPSWVEASKEPDEEERARKLRSLARALPGPHLATLRFVMAHLNSVASAADVNKMKIRNLAIVFGKFKKTCAHSFC